MQNIEIQITPDDVLLLRVNLQENQGFTTSNRSVRVASTEGNILLWKDGKPHPLGVKLNLNVFRNFTAEEKAEAVKGKPRRRYGIDLRT